MTHTLISLISILLGILSANFLGLLFKKYSSGFRANTIAGVFGSIFFVKFFGRLGFNPFFVVQNGEIIIVPLLLNCLVSIMAGGVGFFILYKIRIKTK